MGFVLYKTGCFEELSCFCCRRVCSDRHCGTFVRASVAAVGECPGDGAACGAARLSERSGGRSAANTGTGGSLIFNCKEALKQLYLPSLNDQSALPG